MKKLLNQAGVAKIRSKFGFASGMKLWMTGVQCTGTETRLDKCNFNYAKRMDCSDFEDAGVECEIDIERGMSKLDKS